MVRRGIWQVGDVAVLAHLLVDFHDVGERFGCGENPDGIHLSSPQLLLYHAPPGVQGKCRKICQKFAARS